MKKDMPFKQLGIMELVIILVIVILIFGVGRLGKLGKDLGEGIREFRRGISTEEGENKAEETEEETA
ncbi:MAG: twin-arginine translocase TatA/TatE family subunit [Chloroflexota bacterium]|nr:twin-arginine translocase TatA/TatE family subunit [Chloroflexota bacterium]